MRINENRPINGCIMCADDPSFCNPNFCDAALERQNHGCTDSNMCGCCDTCREWAGNSDSNDSDPEGYYDLCDGTDVCGCSACVVEHVICSQHNIRIAICGCNEPTDPDESEEWLDDAPDNSELDDDARYQSGERGRSLLVPCEHCGSVDCTAGSVCLTNSGLADEGPGQWRGLDVAAYAPTLSIPAACQCPLNSGCQCNHDNATAVADLLEGTPNQHNTASWERRNTSPEQIEAKPCAELDQLIAQMEVQHA